MLLFTNQYSATSLSLHSLIFVTQCVFIGVRSCTLQIFKRAS